MKYLEVSSISDEDKPYAHLIINGSKTWEIRWHNTNYRGLISIIFNNQIIGTARLVRTFKMTPKELSKFDNHCSNYKNLSNYAKAKKVKELYAWVLSGAKKLSKPQRVNYKFINNYDWSIIVRNK